MLAFQRRFYAVVGFFLETEAARLFVPPEFLDRLARERPSSPMHLDRGKRGGGPQSVAWVAAANTRSAGLSLSHMAASQTAGFTNGWTRLNPSRLTPTRSGSRKTLRKIASTSRSASNAVQRA